MVDEFHGWKALNECLRRAGILLDDEHLGEPGPLERLVDGFVDVAHRGLVPESGVSRCRIVWNRTQTTTSCKEASISYHRNTVRINRFLIRNYAGTRPVRVCPRTLGS